MFDCGILLLYKFGKRPKAVHPELRGSRRVLAPELLAVWISLLRVGTPEPLFINPRASAPVSVAALVSASAIHANRPTRLAFSCHIHVSPSTLAPY